MRTIALAAFAALTATCCLGADNTASDPEKGKDLEKLSALEEKSKDIKERNNGIRFAVDIFRPTADLYLLDPSSAADTTAELSGMMPGASLAYLYKGLVIEGTYRSGSLEGDADYAYAATSDLDCDRQELELALGFTTKGKVPFYIGLGYSFLYNEYEETYYRPGQPSRDYDFEDRANNVYIQLGLGVPINLYRSPSVRYTLVPRVLGSAGIGYLWSQGQYFSESANSWVFVYKYQFMLLAEAELASGWNFFVEGGFKGTGFANYLTVGGGNYYGPAARAGIKFSW